MSGAIGEMLESARSDRIAGRSEAAERGYAAAASQARAEGETLALAHALRHVSDLARERSSPAEALCAAAEAVAIYRAEAAAGPLDLANALRLKALALADSGHAAEAASLWREARDLYSTAGVQAGVEDADKHLAGV